MADFNPWLTPGEGNKGDLRTVEAAGQYENICWQTRWAPLSPFENRLPTVLQAIFAAGIYELPLIVGEPNARRIAGSGNAAVWTEQNFVDDMAHLAYQPRA